MSSKLTLQISLKISKTLCVSYICLPIPILTLKTLSISFETPKFSLNKEFHGKLIKETHVSPHHYTQSGRNFTKHHVMRCNIELKKNDRKFISRICFPHFLGKTTGEIISPPHFCFPGGNYFPRGKFFPSLFIL